jgi:hypothetical protein
MVAALATVKVAVICAIEHIQAIQNILGSVAMNNIEQYQNAKSMCGINQVLEFLRCAAST